MMSINKLLINFNRSSNPIINFQSIRHLRPRKPFWLGIAKSKISKVPEKRIKRGADEAHEFQKLESLYATKIKSLKKFIKETNPLLQKYGEKNQAVESLPHMKAKIKNSLNKNEMFNVKSSELRCQRLNKEIQEFKKKAEKQIEKVIEERAKRTALLDEVVKLEKIKSETYITQENLDEAIEKCLNEVVEYNYAIDINGNKYVGREPLVKGLFIEANKDLNTPDEDTSEESHKSEALPSPT